jgi:ABC-type transport system substrate-binding protein
VRTRDPLTGRGLLNPGFSSPKLDGLIDRASALIDAATRLDLIQQAVKLTEDEVPAVPLFEVVRVWGHARDVSFQPRPDGRIDLTAISFRP